MHADTPLTYEQSLAYALRLLSQRGYSVARLQEKMRQRGAPQDVAEAVCAKLTDLRLLNDAEYAKEVARSQAVYRRSSNRMIALKLRQKGIPRELAEETLASPSDDTPSELARAKEVGMRYAEKYRELPSREKRHKVAAYLFRRGFSSSVIRSVIEAL